MQYLRMLSLCGLLCLPMWGCGGNSRDGEVADAPESTPVELTPEEEAAEREYVNQEN